MFTLIKIHFLFIPQKGITTNATVSTPSPILNLTDINSTISVDRLISAVGWEYLRTKPISKEDGGWNLVSKQKGFQLINPTDDWFPGMPDKIFIMVC